MLGKRRQDRARAGSAAPMAQGAMLVRAWRALLAFRTQFFVCERKGGMAGRRGMQRNNQLRVRTGKNTA